MRSQRHYAPLPGSGIPPRGLFVSRWNALLRASSLLELGEFSVQSFDSECSTLLARALQRGWKIYVCGNEPAVARGQCSDERWASFEQRFQELCKAQGLVLTRHYACLDSTQGKGAHQRESVFEFPGTGVFYHAAQEDGIELSESWILSSDTLELAAGWRAGLRTGGIGQLARRQAGELAVEPDLCASAPGRLLQEVLARDPLAR